VPGGSSTEERDWRWKWSEAYRPKLPPSAWPAAGRPLSLLPGSPPRAANHSCPVSHQLAVSRIATARGRGAPGLVGVSLAHSYLRSSAVDGGEQGKSGASAVGGYRRRWWGWSTAGTSGCLGCEWKGTPASHWAPHARGGQMDPPIPWRAPNGIMPADKIQPNRIRQTTTHWLSRRGEQEGAQLHVDTRRASSMDADGRTRPWQPSRLPPEPYKLIHVSVESIQSSAAVRDVCRTTRALASFFDLTVYAIAS
jgi:hypothetical protein